MEEEWVEVGEFPNYAVSNYGYVMNQNTGHILRPQDNGSGFVRVELWEQGYHRKVYIHHLVAMAFFDDYRTGMHIRHVNGDKSNNSTRNLALRKQSPAELGEWRKPNERTWGKKVRIVETGDIFRTVRECARYIDGDYSSIYAVLKGRRMTHAGYTFEWFDDGGNGEDGWQD